MLIIPVACRGLWTQANIRSSASAFKFCRVLSLFCLYSFLGLYIALMIRGTIMVITRTAIVKIEKDSTLKICLSQALLSINIGRMPLVFISSPIDTPSRTGIP
ncbi:hypothetical protein V8G54_018118 [Vigna mungo]|uniref:Uncharacterized protein n=1 Tax=Vigna mungo TaxID=3915 RepID=A0AAQ3RSE8_VIGMU